MKNYHILLVDDEENLMECLEMVLSIEGHTVTTANSGEKALDLIREIYKHDNRIDMLITDICMPGMSGMELIKELNQQKIYPLTIGISGFTDDKTIAELCEKGCDDLILKPFTPEELLCRISKVVKSA